MNKNNLSQDQTGVSEQENRTNETRISSGKTRKKDLRYPIATALFIALAYICVFAFRFQVGGFLTFEIKDAVMAVGTFWLGPVASIVIPFCVSLLEMISISGTGFYGFLMNFLSSMAYCLTATLFFRIRKNRLGATIGLIAAIFTATALMLLCNLIITPIYMGISISEVGAMIPNLLLPFNLIKTIVNGCVALLLYTPVRNAVRRTRLFSLGEESGKGPHWLIPVGAIALCILSLTIFFLVLDGDFKFWVK